LTGQALWSLARKTGVPALSGGKVVAPGAAGGLLVLNRVDGKLGRELSLGQKLMGQPALSGNRAVWLTADRQLLAVDIRTGKQLWSKRIAKPISPPVANRSALFMATLSSKGRLQLVRRAVKTAKIQWARQLGKPLGGKAPFSFRPPAVDGDEVYAGLPDGYVYALDAGKGQIRWTMWAGVHLETPALDRRKVYVALRRKGRSQISALNRLSGRLRWRRRIKAGISSSLAAGGKRVIFTDGKGHLLALDAETGAEAWVLPLKSGIKGFPAVYGGLAAAVGSTGSTDALWLWNLNRGDLIFRKKLKGRAVGPPVFTKGLILVGGDRLRAFR